jgi:hypothetical protein
VDAGPIIAGLARAAGPAWIAAAALAAAWWAKLAWNGLATRRRVDLLPGVAPAPPPGGWPGLTVVVPARDEERGVEAAVGSLLDQDYPALSVVAVDDRSRDATGALLDRMAKGAPRLTVLHVTALPSGWLGKNHACMLGASAAPGRWILFTDGDVVFAPGTLRRAVAYAESRGLGHLVALPRLVAPGRLERAFVTAFAALANPAFRTWELRRAGTSGFIGIGAFNLVRADAYRRTGGHRRVALEALDDVKLGLVLRRSGVRQGAVDSGGLVSVRWNAGFRASWRGLLKNAFAGTEFRGPVALAAAAGVTLVSVAPALALLLGPAWPARMLGLAGLLLSAAVVGTTGRRFGGGDGTEGLWLPVTGPALALAVVASALLVTARGGVVWRGSFYPLRDLRAGCVRVRDWPADASVGWDPRWC